MHIGRGTTLSEPTFMEKEKYHSIVAPLIDALELTYKNINGRNKSWASIGSYEGGVVNFTIEEFKFKFKIDKITIKEGK